MVAISLYRGNLHRVPEVPRRWVMPTPTISLKDFRNLLVRRSKALAHLNLSDLPISSFNRGSCLEGRNPDPVLHYPDVKNAAKTESTIDSKILDDGKSRIMSLTVDGKGKRIDADSSKEKFNFVSNSSVFEEKEPDGVTKLHSRLRKNDDEQLNNCKEKRKREIEEKLDVLKTRKHNLVQALKQVLSAEQHLKFRKGLSLYSGRPSPTLNVDVTNDSGSISREATPRLGSEVTVGGDGEAGDAEDLPIQSVQRRVPRTCSLSPSSESPIRRPLHHNVPHPSPSRFAPTAQGNTPSITLSGTNFVASSPSPAASGGTSAFRDARQPSPWN